MFSGLFPGVFLAFGGYKWAKIRPKSKGVSAASQVPILEGRGMARNSANSRIAPGGKGARRELRQVPG